MQFEVLCFMKLRGNGFNLCWEELESKPMTSFWETHTPFDRLAPACPRTTLGLCRPAPARNCQQEKQRGAVKETQVGKGNAARSAHAGEINVKSSENPKDQREGRADQA